MTGTPSSMENDGPFSIVRQPSWFGKARSSIKRIRGQQVDQQTVGNEVNQTEQQQDIGEQVDQQSGQQP